MMIKKQIRKYFPLIVLTVSILLYSLAMYAPRVLPYVYPRWIYSLVSQGFSILFSLIPFSFAELMLLLLPLWCLYGLGKGLYLCVLRREGAGAYWCRLCKISWNTACYLLCVFILFTGINYHRKPLVEYAGLKVQPVLKEELVQLCIYLTDLTNEAAEHTNRNRDGRFIPQHTFSQNQRLVSNAYDSLSTLFPIYKGRYPSSKPLVFSYWVSYAHIMGFLFPFTFEVNINKDIPPFLIPAVIAHEQAHVRGLMREEEAEYSLVLLARHTTDRELQYSFYLSTLMRAMGVLYRADDEQYWQVTERFSQLLVNDFNQNTSYWRAFMSPVGTISKSVNDAYLKANS
ncbi:MAG: DUF3810 domain-containing protein, partial [Bacteroidales bacterium]|nr:DUF3810 domain-containing protein [Bacteroidales bacterium]